MSNESKPTDPFFVSRIYPDAQAMFSWRIRSLTEVISSCLVALDTNTLLLPYTIGAKSLKEIGNLFRTLASEERLMIPGQVAREFARNRPEKLSQLFKQLNDKMSSPAKLSVGRYPLLEGLPDYQRAIELEGQLNDLIGQYQGALSSVIKHVRGWDWNDPVSLLYGELFDGAVLTDLELEETTMRQDLAWRQEHKVPPGYKDAAKDDSGAGDYVIWRTILQEGKESSRDLVFVTGEKKADWWHRSNNESLYPRHELVDEYRRESGGRSFHIVSLSELLDLVGASAEAVEEVRQEEADAIKPDVIADAATLVELEDEWLVIREAVRRVSRQVEALLREIRPIAVYNDRIVLAAPYEFHRNRLNSDEVRSVIEEVLSDFLGKSVSVETILRGELPQI